MFNISYMNTEVGLIHQIARAPYILNEYSLEQFYQRICADEDKLCNALTQVKKFPDIESILPLLNYLKQGKAYEMIISKLDSAIYPVEHHFFNNADYVFLWQEAAHPLGHKTLKKLELGTLYPRRESSNSGLKGQKVALAQWKISGVECYSFTKNPNVTPKIESGETGTKDQIITRAYREIYKAVTKVEYISALGAKPEQFIIIDGKYKRVKRVLYPTMVKFDCVIETYNDGIIQGLDWRVVNPNQFIRRNIELYCATCDRLGTLHGLDMFYVETRGPMCGPCRDHYMENDLIREDMIHH